MIENVSTPFNRVGNIAQDQVLVVQNISQWVDELLPQLYANETLDLTKTISKELILNRNTTESSFLNLTKQDLANYAVFFKNNYFTGMRISTV